jgi:hypothetical protein
MRLFSHPIGAGAAMSPGSQILELTTKRATAKTTMMAAGRRAMGMEVGETSGN